MMNTVMAIRNLNILIWLKVVGPQINSVHKRGMFFKKTDNEDDLLEKQREHAVNYF